MQAGQPTDAARRLLDAAEALFGATDPDHVSTRRITGAAGCNPGAINYHFGSKDGLLEAVLTRRLGHLSDERSRRIADLEARSTSPSPAELIAIVADPLVTLVHDDPDHGPAWVRLIARLWLTRRTIVTHRAAQTTDAQALAVLARRTLGHLEPADAALRWTLAVDVVLMTLGDPFASLADVPFDVRAHTAVESASAMLQRAADGSAD